MRKVTLMLLIVLGSLFVSNAGSAQADEEKEKPGSGIPDDIPAAG